MFGALAKGTNINASLARLADWIVVSPLSHITDTVKIGYWTECVLGHSHADGRRALVAAGTLVMEDAEAKSIAQQLSLLEDASKFKLAGRAAEALGDLKILLK